MDRDAEASRRNLLDCTAAVVPVVIRCEADGILAALTGVTFAPHMVHGYGKRFMGLAADGAQRHGAG